MTDEELIDRLRRTLQSEAAAIRPGPDSNPVPSYPAQGPAPRSRLAAGRWPLAVAAAAVAAAIGLLVAYWPGGGGPSRLGVVSPSSPTTPAAPTPPTTLAAPSPATTAPVAAATGVVPTTAAAPTTTPPAPTTVPAPAGAPAGFAPQSVTFVSANEGWVAGTAPCSSGSCLSLERSFDGGRNWSAVPAPPLTFPNAAYPGPEVAVRFANGRDGWIYRTQPVSLWSTHDGGASWHQALVPGLTAGATVMAMEASAGRVHVAIIPAGGDTVHLVTSPVSADSWVDTDTGAPIGAGPVPAAQLVLQKSQGWLLENDRTVVSGARLNGTGWGPWTPPCQSANGTAALAASTPADLVAVCQEGVWGPARNLPAGAQTPSTWVFRSSSGGATFQAVGSVPGATRAAVVASPAPSTVVIGGSGQNPPDLTASFDGGHTWQAVYRSPEVHTWSYLGFTTLTQGVAIGSGGNGPAVMVMTRDGGHTWTTVSFGQGE